jgi:pimeloyl-ACP methyl ester carboxylesterase
MWNRYERDVAQAWKRVRAVPSRTLRTGFGTIEYATSGEGQPVLVSHGVMGGHPHGLGMVATYYGPAFAISPSRFGYFGSSLPADASPAQQADVYAELLDELGVDRAVAIGFSAGGASAIEFALRHPERVDWLVLASSALPRAFDPMPSVARKLGPVFMRAALSSDRPFWLFKSLMPRTFRHLLGVPKGFVGTSDERETLEEVATSIFPIPPKRDGAVFDTFTGNPHVDNCPIEDITVPTLIVHAADDSLAPYQSAHNAAARMPFARFVTIDKGGHEFLGTEREVRDAIKTYLSELRERQPVQV